MKGGDNVVNFAIWVRDTRTARRMTQTECAARAGMKLQQWNQIEKQVKNPERPTVLNVARGLQVSETEALSAAGYQSVPMDVPAELATIWQSVPRERQAGFLRAVRQVVGGENARSFHQGAVVCPAVVGGHIAPVAIRVALEILRGRQTGFEEGFPGPWCGARLS